jgi:hypothetical protein
MRRASALTCPLVALAILIVMNAPAMAQRRGFNIPPSVQNLFMLRMEAVQKELALDAEQTKAINDLAGKMQTEAVEIMSGLQDLTPEEQKEELPGIMKTVAERGKEIQEQVDKVLNEKQRARTNELSLQRRGLQALQDDTVIDALKLTDEQKKKLEAIRGEVADKQEKIIADTGGDRNKAREQFGALQQKAGEDVMAVLTPEQREQFEKMKGAKFEFPRQRGLF